MGTRNGTINHSWCTRPWSFRAVYTRHACCSSFVGRFWPARKTSPESRIGCEIPPLHPLRRHDVVVIKICARGGVSNPVDIALRLRRCTPCLRRHGARSNLPLAVGPSTPALALASLNMPRGGERAHDDDDDASGGDGDGRRTVARVETMKVATMGSWTAATAGRGATRIRMRILTTTCFMVLNLHEIKIQGRG